MFLDRYHPILLNGNALTHYISKIPQRQGPKYTESVRPKRGLR